jgi:hypothetical protein
VGIGAILGFVLYESNLLFSMSANIPISLWCSVVPIVAYVNSDLEKKTIIVVNKGKSGIYRWVNKESGKCYVGSAVNLSKRIKLYYCYNHIAGRGRNMLINRA